MIDKYFLEIFESVYRQGPGSDNETTKAYNLCNDLPEEAKVLDIGCGKGAQSIQLSKLTAGHVIASDMHLPFLNELQKFVEKNDLSNKITCMKADMAELPFLADQFDLLWSEGAIYILGYQYALEQWEKFIKPNGYLVFSDCVWLSSDNRPDELTKYWEKEGLVLPTVEEIKENALKHGYQIIDHFTLQHSSWKDQFYNHIEKELEKARKKYTEITEAQTTFDAIETEIEMYDKYNNYFGYEFFVLKK